ncbi:MAG: hypothetical protein VW258_00840 [Thalassolituus sp.]
MQYCHFHPAAAATWHCPRCHNDVCDQCTDEASHTGERRCCECNSALESLGAANTAEPFWNRLTEVFRYPLTTPVISLIVIVSALTAFLSYLPVIGFVAALISAGIFTKYSFACLEDTASGQMSPPDLAEGYSGGVVLIIKMLLLIVLLGIGGAVMMEYLGPGITGFIGMLVLLSIPAFLINYALTENLVQSASPFAILRIVSAVGTPYMVLIGLLFLMASSVGVLSYLVIGGWEWVTLTLQSVIANFYMVVMFHLMGYVVFQYQEELGFYAREEHAGQVDPRTEYERFRDRIGVAIKIGDYLKATELLQKALDKNPGDNALHDELMELIVLTNNADAMAEYADEYLNFKLQKGYASQLKSGYRQIRKVMPEYIPESPDMRYRIAKDHADIGEYAAAVRLINGMHKNVSDKPLLISAYSLMAEAMDALGKTDKANACRAFLQKLGALTV